MYREPRYLEIGVGDSSCFERIAAHSSYAVGVDTVDNPYGPRAGDIMRQICSVPTKDYYDCGSDEFFKLWFDRPDHEGYGNRFDLIFIDGSHWIEQVERDVFNALDILAPNGTIAMHDTWAANAEEAAQGSDTAYLLAVEMEADPAYQCFTLPIRPGITLLRPNVARSY